MRRDSAAVHHYAHDGLVTFFSRPGTAGLILSVLAALGIGVYLVCVEMPHRQMWLIALACVVLLAWVGRAGTDFVLSQQSPLSITLSFIMIAAGSFTAVTTASIMLFIAALGLIRLIADPHIPTVLGVLATLVAMLSIVAGPLVAHDISLAELVIELAVVLIMALIGLARRSRQQGWQRENLLREQQDRARHEAARVALSREIHDVLAHSLGGLVIQLDAVDALLEVGDVTEARERVHAASDLARYGMAEARRAVTALRDDPTGVTSTARIEQAEITASLTDLLSAHRALGGEVEEYVTGEPQDLPAPTALALQRAVQESLSNVRKHAPGVPVRIEIAWHTDRVTLTVSNSVDSTPSDTPLARTGTGSGLTGMRERFEALPHGGFAEAGVVGDRFVVTAEALLQ